MKEKQTELYQFLKAVRGNWHNAIYISCKHCPGTKASQCRDFLMSADAEGHPILIPVNVLHLLTGEEITPEDCRGMMEKQVFETLYSLYIEWHTVSQNECPLLQLSQTASDIQKD